MSQDRVTEVPSVGCKGLTVSVGAGNSSGGGEGTDQPSCSVQVLRGGALSSQPQRAGLTEPDPGTHSHPPSLPPWVCPPHRPLNGEASPWTVSHTDLVFPVLILQKDSSWTSQEEKPLTLGLAFEMV